MKVNETIKVVAKFTYFRPGRGGAGDNVLRSWAPPRLC